MISNTRGTPGTAISGFIFFENCFRYMKLVPIHTVTLPIRRLLPFNTPATFYNFTNRQCAALRSHYLLYIVSTEFN